MTTADTIVGLVETLRLATNTDHQDFGAGICQWCGHDVDLCDEASGCLGWKMRAALDAWDKRQPLRSDADLLHAVYGPLYRTMGLGIAEGAALSADILDALEPLLLGPRGAGKETPV